MSDDGIGRYRRWFEYERDSHAKVLAAFDATPDHLRQSQGFRKAVDLMAHIVVARRLWLHRLGGAAVGPTEFFPRNVALEVLAAEVEEVHRAWSAYLGRLTAAALAELFEYQSSEGPRYRNTVEDILTQMFGHSLYHRGQIALLLREAGAEPAVTDFVFWTRTPIPPGTPA